MTAAASRQHRYANARNPQIAATLNGLFEFTTQARAEAKLETITRNFTVTRQKQEDVATPHVILWISDYDVTGEEEAKGYLGNYAMLSIEKIKGEDLWTIRSTKVERELKNHPRRKRPESRCPNWGHPVLRSVLKEANYATLEEANQQLKALHHEYPETTIPGENKLFLMIFSRKTDAKNPIQRYVLEIKNLQGGGFTITSAKNEFKRKPNVPAEVAATETGKPSGHFVSMVALKKKRKKPN